MLTKKLNTENTTNNNDYYYNVLHLRLYNKDVILVTQASILVILFVIERKTLYNLRVHSHNIPQCIYTATTATKAKNTTKGPYSNEE